jgi:hypothetical protein
MDKELFKDHSDYWQVADNIRDIYMSDGSITNLLDFERVLDEVEIYAFKNWEIGELVAGPEITKYRVGCTFMWPENKMPEPKGGKRLLDYGCRVEFGQDQFAKVRKIKTPDDIRPGTRKGKIDQEPVWMIKITMPKKLMNDINRGYTELDKNKIEDIVSASGVNAQIDPAEQQAQEMANAQPAPAA